MTLAPLVVRSLVAVRVLALAALAPAGVGGCSDGADLEPITRIRVDGGVDVTIEAGEVASADASSPADARSEAVVPDASLDAGPSLVEAGADVGGEASSDAPLSPSCQEFCAKEVAAGCAMGRTVESCVATCTIMYGGSCGTQAAQLNACLVAHEAAWMCLNDRRVIKSGVCALELVTFSFCR